MTTKTHLETGMVLSLVASGLATEKLSVMDISPLSKIGAMAAIVVGITAGSIYPDIDHNGSNLNTCDVKMGWESKLDHRGVVHTLINSIGILLPFMLLNLLLKAVTSLNTIVVSILGVSMSIGCVWHMMLDTLTPKGIMWLYPFTLYRFRIPIIKSYTTERLFRIVVTAVLLYGAVYLWKD